MRISIIFILGLLFLASCDEVPKLSSISKMTTTFDTGSTSYPGGVIVVGERQDAPGTVSYSFSSSQNSVALEKGDWIFYAVGYAGPTKFAGAKSCAMTSISFRKGKSISLGLNLSTDGCSGKLARTLKFRSVYTHSCAINKDYQSGSDQFIAPTDALLGTYCSSPAEQDDNISQYKIFSLNVVNGIISTGFSSACINTNIFAPALDLPTDKMPLSVKFYKSFHECSEDANPHLTYNLTSGIAGDYSSSFDKLIREFSTANYQLFLPAALTKRMKSPFLDMIPRMNCGTFGSFTNCGPEPFQSIHARVPWDFPLKNQLLMKNVTSSNCNNVNVDSKLFAIENCTIRNRTMYGTIRRNALTCMPNSSGPGPIVDLYERNGKVYLLYRNGLNTEIAIFSDTGKIDQTFLLATDHTFISFAADNDGTIYAMAPTQIAKFEKNSSGVYTLTAVELISNGSLIEVTPDGNHLFIAKNSGNIFETYHTSPFTFKSSTAYPDMVPANQLQFYKGILYSGHDTSNAGTPAGIVYRSYFNATAGVLSPNTTNIGFENDINRFYITEDNRYYLLHNSGVSYVYSINPTTGDPAIISGASGTISLPNATSYVSTRNVHYYSDGSDFKAYNVNSGGVWTIGGIYNGNCGEDVVLTDGTNSQMISVESYHSSPANFNNIHLFEAGMKFGGRRDPLGEEANEFLFSHLNENNNKSSLGGGLNRVQRMLGPHGIGGMFHDFATCADLETVLGVGEINRTLSVDDPYSGFRTYNIRARTTTNPLIPYYCNDSDPTGTCTNTANLRINVTTTGLLENERFAVKLKCSSKVGSMELLRYDSDEKRNELFWWNTNDNTKARYENIKSYKTTGFFTGEITMANKTGVDDLWGRNILIEKSPDLIKSKAVEYNRDISRHMATFLEIIDAPDSYPTNTDYVSERSNNDFTGLASLCLANNDTNMGAASIAGCNVNNEYTATSFGMSLSLDVLSDADDDTSVFQSKFSFQP